MAKKWWRLEQRHSSGQTSSKAVLEQNQQDLIGHESEAGGEVWAAFWVSDLVDVLDVEHGVIREENLGVAAGLGDGVGEGAGQRRVRMMAPLQSPEEEIFSLGRGGPHHRPS